MAFEQVAIAPGVAFLLGIVPLAYAWFKKAAWLWVLVADAVLATVLAVMFWWFWRGGFNPVEDQILKSFSLFNATLATVALASVYRSKPSPDGLGFALFHDINLPWRRGLAEKWNPVASLQSDKAPVDPAALYQRAQAWYEQHRVEFERKHRDRYCVVAPDSGEYRIIDSLSGPDATFDPEFAALPKVTIRIGTPFRTSHALR